MANRNFENIERRMSALGAAHCDCRVLAEVSEYPIFCVSIGSGRGLPPVFVTGGLHGDEPAGVETVLRFLEHDVKRWIARFSFEAIPCLNPYGWENNARNNAEGVDINWSYDRDDVVEIQVIKGLVKDRRFEVVIDCHEDWESPGFYLYELRRNGEMNAREILRRVAEVCPLNISGEIEGRPAEGGLVTPDLAREKRLRGEGIPLALYDQHTDHLLTTETPTGLDMETRVAAQLAVLDVVLEAHGGNERRDGGTRRGLRTRRVR